MDLTLYQVDAFTDRLFAGNPAGVVPSDAWIDDGAMQNIAMENNLAETAFFVPLPDDPKHDFHLRWFTPAIEVDLCGHATLASAAVLYRQLDWAHDEIRFLSRSGTLVVRKRQDMLELDFPAAPPAAADMPAGLADAIGVATGLVRARRHEHRDGDGREHVARPRPGHGVHRRHAGRRVDRHRTR